MDGWMDFLYSDPSSLFTWIFSNRCGFKQFSPWTVWIVLTCPHVLQMIAVYTRTGGKKKKRKTVKVKATQCLSNVNKLVIILFSNIFFKIRVTVISCIVWYRFYPVPLVHIHVCILFCQNCFWAGNESGIDRAAQRHSTLRHKASASEFLSCFVLWIIFLLRRGNYRHTSHTFPTEWLNPSETYTEMFSVNAAVTVEYHHVFSMSRDFYVCWLHINCVYCSYATIKYPHQ